LLLGLAVLVLISGFGSGVVREHCVDHEASNASGELRLASHWTYVIWPPLVFAATDPSDPRCVRNQPGTAVLQYIGVRDGPNEQVRKHVEKHLGK
jgi:hypothetical protein